MRRFLELVSPREYTVDGGGGRGWVHPANPDLFTELLPQSQEPTAGSVRRVNRYTDL